MSTSRSTTPCSSECPFLKPKPDDNQPILPNGSHSNDPSMLYLLKSWKIWRLLIYIVFVVINLGIRLIIVPIIGRKFFEEENTSDNDCNTDTNALWSYWSNMSISFAALIGFLTQTYIGRLSDAHGRKPFLVATIILLFLWNGILCFTQNMWIYLATLPIIGLNGAFTGMPTIYQAMISDVTPKQHRTLMFLFGFGFAGILFIVAAILTRIVQNSFGLLAPVYMSQIFLLFGLLWTIFMVEETLNIEDRVNMRQSMEIFHATIKKKESMIEMKNITMNEMKDENIVELQIIQTKDKVIGGTVIASTIDYGNDGQKKDIENEMFLHSNVSTNGLYIKRIVCKCCQSQFNPFLPFMHLKNNPLIFWVCMATLITAIPETGIDHITMSYIADILELCEDGENTKVNSYNTMAMGTSMVLTQLLLLPMLIRFCTSNDIYLIFIGIIILLMYMLTGIAMYFYPSLVFSILIYCCFGMALILPPVMNGALSKRLSKQQQGLGMGILHAMKGFTSCFAPYLFAYLYSMYAREHLDDAFWKTLPFMFGLVIVLGGIPLVFGPLKKQFHLYDSKNRSV